MSQKQNKWEKHKKKEREEKKRKKERKREKKKEKKERKKKRNETEKNERKKERKKKREKKGKKEREKGKVQKTKARTLTGFEPRTMPLVVGYLNHLTIVSGLIRQWHFSGTNIVPTPSDTGSFQTERQFGEKKQHAADKEKVGGVRCAWGVQVRVTCNQRLQRCSSTSKPQKCVKNECNIQKHS